VANVLGMARTAMNVFGSTMSVLVAPRFTESGIEAATDVTAVIR
jgi:L-cystine uptake protein TcyP (sodium:dicarboxylate symporter family)